MRSLLTLASVAGLLLAGCSEPRMDDGMAAMSCAERAADETFVFRVEVIDDFGNLLGGVEVLLLARGHVLDDAVSDATGCVTLATEAGGPYEVEGYSDDRDGCSWHGRRDAHPAGLGQTLQLPMAATCP